MSEEQIEDNMKMGMAMGIGFLFSYLFSHPTSQRSLKKTLPTTKYKNIEFLPNVKIKYRDKIFWLHHWMSYSSLYVLLFATKRKFIRNRVLTGFLLGNILQGLTYKDRFKFSQKINEVMKSSTEAK